MCDNKRSFIMSSTLPAASSLEGLGWFYSTIHLTFLVANQLVTNAAACQLRVQPHEPLQC